MHTALILIDVQESFRQRPYWVEAPAQGFLARANALVEGCAARSVPIVRILHSDGPAVASNPFAIESGFVRPLAGVAPFDAAAEFVKHRHSALVGTGLTVWLHRNRIARLIVAGIRTEQCCETTARHASDEGFEVDYVAEATLTFDMRHLDGTPLPAADIVARTTAVLTDRFATICSVAQALERAA
ncbi:MAG TPA: isochorismatase family protein [Burkholderiaceae bacterium]|nr:isochorismatase family protein [Burkholderiaceae bacterium]